MNKQQKLGQLIAERRATCGMSLRELARRVDVAPNTVRNIEAGEHKTSSDKLLRIAIELQLDAAQLFGLAGYNTGTHMNEAIKMSLDVSGLRADQLGHVQAYIDGLRERSIDAR